MTALGLKLFQRLSSVESVYSHYNLADESVLFNSYKRNRDCFLKFVNFVCCILNLILFIQTLALYKSFTYLLTYLLTKFVRFRYRFFASGHRLQCQVGCGRQRTALPAPGGGVALRAFFPSCICDMHVRTYPIVVFSSFTRYYFKPLNSITVFGPSYGAKFHQNRLRVVTVVESTDRRTLV